MMNDYTTEADDPLFLRCKTRFTRKEKDAFLDRCKAEFSRLGYGEHEITVQKSVFGKNLVVGPPDADTLITAHYDTPGRTGFLLAADPLVGNLLSQVVTMLLYFGYAILLSIALYYLRIESSLLRNFLIISPLILAMCVKNKDNLNDNTSGVIGVINVAAHVSGNPDLREKCAFVLFDNEERGLFGSLAFSRWRSKNFPAKRKSAVINLDCIGCGDIVFLAAHRKNTTWHTLAEHLENTENIDLVKEINWCYISDNFHFPEGVMLSFVKKSRLGPIYLPNIHTGKDTVCDLEKIKKLSASLFEYLKDTERCTP